MAYTKTTTKDLADLLTERNTEGKYNAIIERAKSNGYHDFKFDEEKYPDTFCPKVDLVSDLGEFPELADVRQQVVDGEYDESPDEEDEKKLLEDFPFLKNM